MTSEESKAKQYNVEYDLLDNRGYRQVVIRLCRDYSSHRCGYVGIPKTHPLYGKDYNHKSNVRLDGLTVQINNPVGTFLAAASIGEEEYADLSYAANVNGGLTYAQGTPDYPVESDLWWFGYDCAHIDDIDDGGKPLDFCIAECEKLSQFLDTQKEPTA